MKKDEFLKPNNPLLYKKAKSIKKIDLHTKLLLDVVKKMEQIAGVHQNLDKTKPVMVGLAAPQIGYGIKLIFVNIHATSKRDHTESNNIFMVNPKILSHTTKAQRDMEGCYSTNPKDFDMRGIVSRYVSVTVKYMTLDGVTHTEKFSGFTAVIIQHEIDHLDGKVFVHRIKKEQDLHLVFPSELKKYQKEYHTWKRCMHLDLYFSDIVCAN